MSYGWEAYSDQPGNYPWGNKNENSGFTGSFFGNKNNAQLTMTGNPWMGSSLGMAVQPGKSVQGSFSTTSGVVSLQFPLHVTGPQGESFDVTFTASTENTTFPPEPYPLAGQRLTDSPFAGRKLFTVVAGPINSGYLPQLGGSYNFWFGMGGDIADTDLP
jgi:hypothetical protein